MGLSVNQPTENPKQSAFDFPIQPGLKVRSHGPQKGSAFKMNKMAQWLFD